MDKMKLYFALTIFCSSTVHAAFLIPPAASAVRRFAAWVGKGSEPLTEEKCNVYLDQQDYSELEATVYYHLELYHEAPVFDLITKGIYARKDPFCLYSLIRNKVFAIRANATVDTAYVQDILEKMLISLILLAGDLSFCIIWGSSSDELDERYAQMRNIYKYWYDNYLVNNKIPFKSVYESAIKWLLANAKIEQPSPFWSLHFEVTGKAISFKKPSENQLQTYHDEKIKELVMDKRRASLQDYIDSLKECDEWHIFFAHKLLSNLNRKALHAYVKAKPEQIRASDAAASTTSQNDDQTQ